MQSLINRFVKISIDDITKTLEVAYLGFVLNDEFEKILDYEFELIIKHSLTSCLIDLTKMKVYAPGNSDLIKNKWFPTIAELGVKKVAFVKPEDIFAVSSMKTSHKESSSIEGLEICYFPRLQEAKEWLAN